MTTSLADRIGITPSRLLALPQDEQRRVVQFLLRWEAFADALACLDYAPGLDAAAPVLRALAWHGLGRSGEALQRLTDLARNGSEYTLHLTIAEIALDARKSLALTHLQAAIDAAHHPSRVWWVAVRVYLARGDTSLARQAVDQLQAQAPTSHLLAVSTMMLLQAQGDVVTATAYAVRALTQADQLDVSDLVMLRTFFHGVDDRIHSRAVEALLVNRFEMEQTLWRNRLTESPGREIQPAKASKDSLFRRTAAPPPSGSVTHPTANLAASLAASLTVSTEERRALAAEAHALFGFGSLLPGQAEILARVRRGEHLLAVMPTGAGKSLCYQLPAFQGERRLTLVVSPLIALMKDQIDGLPPPLRAQSLAINSLLNGDALRTAMHRIVGGQIRLLYAAPERLRQVTFVETLARAGVARLVIDEAHCVSVWGHDFRPDYLHLRQVHRDLGSPPLLAMTATAPQVVREDIERQLLGAAGTMGVIVGDSFRSNLHLHVLRVRDDDERSALLLQLLRSLQGSGIIYVRSRRRCEELATALQRAGFAAAHYHAGIDNRSEIQDRFMRNELQVIVATVAFGMGIDKGDIRFIVHDGLPSSLENYYQEIGRAGRDGDPAQCVMLFADHDEKTQLRLASRTPLTIDVLRALYQRVRESLGGRCYGRVALESLAATVGDATNARVGLSLLEEAGLLHRGYDAPRTVTINRPRQLRGAQDTAFMDFALRCGLDRAATVTGDFVGLAEHVAMAPQMLERWLLAWQDARYLAVHFDGRDPLIETPSPPVKAADQLAQILRNRAVLDQQRVGDIARYARTTGCRHAFLADYLGGEHRTRCAACDNCGRSLVLVPVAAEFDGEADLLIVLRTLGEQTWGRRNLVRLLRGDPAASERAQRTSFYGALRKRSERSLEQLIDSLQGDGLIQPRELEHGGVILELTRNGMTTIRNLSHQRRRR
jgi:ATP-dependent DNA helicase RecQ